ncbi:MAG TPA: HTTM domain-containing protein [Saprospiraceae bacterium]|nr:HTTM domain-containing protein [Saprospiraceae bacterium]
MKVNEVSALPLWGEIAIVFGYVVPYYELIFYLGAGCSLCIALGLFTRYTLIINALLCFLIVATPNFFGKLWHNQLFIWVSWLFVASRCNDVWSIDAWRTSRRVPPCEQGTSSVYSIPIRWIWAHMGLIYFFAGIFKLWNSGFDWALSSSMINQIQTEWVQHYDRIPLPRIDHYPNLIKLGGLGLILFELLFPFLLIKPATRLFATLGGLSFHNLSAHYMYIGFYNIQHIYIAFLHNIKRVFSRYAQADKHASWEELKWKNTPTVFKIGLVVFSLNFLCGFFSIHTYPFSSYPTYSALVSDEIDLIHFVGFDKTGAVVDILAEAQKADFRREDCTIYETNIIEAWKNDRPVDTLVKNYWHLWRSNIPALFEVKHLKVYYHRTPVQPERRQEYIVNTLIYESHISVDRE